MRPINAVLLLVIAKFGRRLVEVAISLSRRSATRSLTVFSALSHNNVKCNRYVVVKQRFFYCHMPSLVVFLPLILCLKAEMWEAIFFAICVYSAQQMLKGSISIFSKNIVFIMAKIASKKEKYDTERISRCVWKSQLHYLGTIQQ